MKSNINTRNNTWNPKQKKESRNEDWLAMVDYVTVTEDAGITVTFKDGTEIEA